MCLGLLGGSGYRGRAPHTEAAAAHVQVWPVALCRTSYPLCVVPFSCRVKPRKGKQINTKGGCEVWGGSDRSSLRTRALVLISATHPVSFKTVCFTALMLSSWQKSVHRQTSKHINTWLSTENCFCGSSRNRRCLQDHILAKMAQTDSKNWKHHQPMLLCLLIKQKKKSLQLPVVNSRV